MKPHLHKLVISNAVELALQEDLGRAGDITSTATIDQDAKASAVISSREAGILSGLDVALCAFRMLDEELQIEKGKSDTEKLVKDDIVASISGNARAILAAERVALNFLMRMSGIATCTRQFAEKIEHTGAKVTCTRKTIPGHRAFDKYAVCCGGGSNHRFGLDDAILIKDNHIAISGGVAKAIHCARENIGHLVKVEVEVDNLNQFDEALTAQPDVILLDNMENHQLEEAVERNRKHNNNSIQLEASGNVNIDTIKEIAETGVNYISTSKITMSAPTLDLGLDIKIN